MKTNILITTGGSGGHVIPAMILHDHLSKQANITISTDIRGSRYLDKDNYMEILERKNENWKVTLIDTGENTQTGGRLLRVKDYRKSI